jgi:hypothetical protein
VWWGTGLKEKAFGDQGRGERLKSHRLDRFPKGLTSVAGRGVPPVGSVAWLGISRRGRDPLPSGKPSFEFFLERRRAIHGCGRARGGVAGRAVDARSGRLARRAVVVAALVLYKVLKKVLETSDMKKAYKNK